MKEWFCSTPQESHIKSTEFYVIYGMLCLTCILNSTNFIFYLTASTSRKKFSDGQASSDGLFPRVIASTLFSMRSLFSWARLLLVMIKYHQRCHSNFYDFPVKKYYQQTLIIIHQHHHMVRVITAQGHTFFRDSSLLVFLCCVHFILAAWSAHQDFHMTY